MYEIVERGLTEHFQAQAAIRKKLPVLEQEVWKDA